MSGYWNKNECWPDGTKKKIKRGRDSKYLRQYKKERAKIYFLNLLHKLDLCDVKTMEDIAVSDIFEREML